MLVDLKAATERLIQRHRGKRRKKTRPGAKHRRLRSEQLEARQMLSGNYVVVDTGQSTFYDNSNVISAPASGAAFYGQDAQYDGNQPSYTTSGDGLTVYDNNTELTWTQGADWTGDGVVNVNDKFTYAEALAYVGTLNSENYGGHSDWRVPTTKQLYSLIDFRGTDPPPEGTSTAGLTPFIDSNVFEFAYGDTGAGERIIDSQWVASTLYVANNSMVFGVNFADGRIKGYGMTDPMGGEKTFYAYFVRGNTDYGTNNFTAGGDGTVTDSATALMWSQADSGSGMNWEDALSCAEDSTLAGYDDWRLPNAKELQSLVDYTRSPDTTSSAAIDAMFDSTAITNMAGQEDYPWYWTGTSHLRSNGSAGAGAYLCFGRGTGSFNGSTVTDVHGAGCQRSDPKDGNAASYPVIGPGPQGDVQRVFNYVRLVRDADTTSQNDPPTAEAGGPYSGKPGDTIALDGSASTDTDGTIALYQWDLDADGQYDDATGAAANYSATTVGTFTVGLRVIDNDGAVDTDMATVNVTEQGESFEGYNLFSSLGSTTAYLMDNDGSIVHSWATDYRPGHSMYLLENSELLHTGNVGNTTFEVGGAGGIVQTIDWDGNVTWSYEYSSTTHLQHHDVEILPNGNVLLIAWQMKTQAEAVAAGRDPSLLTDGELWPDSVIEVHPTGSTTGDIVWQWHAWDHLVQDYDATKDNYGVVADHPELIDLNYVMNGGADWNHTNSVDYSAELDQIILSVHHFGEIWVIDHGTTTAEAAGPGGDLLYRWGNPQTYDAGTSADQQLFVQHDAEWIEAGLPGEGNILIFNNGGGRAGGNYSSIEEIVPPVNPNGSYTLAASSDYGPEESIWTYTADTPTDFYAQNISGQQRLPNGNTLICDGPNSNFFEVTASGDTVWEYDYTGAVFRVERYAPSYPGFDGTPLDDDPANVAPTAEAGGPYSGQVGSAITLDGSGSTDSDGTIVLYQWDLDADGQYDDATGATTAFNATTVGIFAVGLRVTDNDGATDTDIASIVVAATNVAPTAEAGGPYSGVAGNAITLDASGSTDSDGTIVLYQWDLDNDGQYDDATGATANYSATAVGIFTVGLRVTDNDGAQDTDTATIAVTAANVAPTAEAGGPYLGEVGSAITLDGSGSTDSDGTIVLYQWDLDNDRQYDDATGATATYSATTVGSFTVGLRVTDNDGAQDTDTATIVVAPANVAPTAEAGGPYSGEVGDAITLDGSGSTDSDGTIVLYRWDLDGDGQYDDATGRAPTFNATAVGTFTVGLRVTDDDGVADVDTTSVAVTEQQIQSLGPITFLEIPDLAPSAGDLWYQLETTLQGFLTVEALFAGPANGVELALYDQDLNPLIDGNERVDWPSEAGETYLLKLSGANPSVDLRLANLVRRAGSQVIVHGTDEADAFEFNAAVSRQVSVNGVRYDFSSEDVASAVFDGAGGVDTFTFHGAATAEWAKLWSDHGRFNGTDYTVTTDNIEFTTADGGGGSDVAQLYDSAGADALVAYSDRGTMTYENGGAVQVDHFRYVHAYASGDGRIDTALLHDTTADLGTSHATWLIGEEGASKMYDTGRGFFNRAKGFDRVVALATGGDDVAQLYDSAGANALVAHSDRAMMTYEDGGAVEADHFRYVHAYASDDGRIDTALLHDTTADLGTSHATWLIGEVGASKMYDTGRGFFNRAKGFDRVIASATGADDVAQLYDSALDDVYSSRPDWSKMDFGAGTSIQLVDFRYVHAYSRAGGFDTATLSDETSSGTSYASSFFGEAASSKLYSDAFFSRAVEFEELRAALGGGDDQVRLYDDPARADHLQVPFPGDAGHAPAKARFHNENRVIYIDDFDWLWATTAGNLQDDEEVDPAYTDDVFLRGNWA